MNKVLQKLLLLPLTFDVRDATVQISRNSVQNWKHLRMVRSTRLQHEMALAVRVFFIFWGVSL